VEIDSAHQNWRMQIPSPDPSPAPWMFADRMYGLAHCLIDRDGRVIGVNLRSLMVQCWSKHR